MGGQGLNRFGWKKRGKLATGSTILPGRSGSRSRGPSVTRTIGDRDFDRDRTDRDRG